ncbi:hypothetical protein ACLFMI_20745 [Pseudonocardia nantongensis]|uniref:hypothetical protein n=1 Tax=Pseudonocardia nantongensis TaxID=1181885 RepID=UPI00397A708E
MDLTPQQRVTLTRLATGRTTADTEPRPDVNWLRHHGLLDADDAVTEAGRAELATLLDERRDRPVEQKPAARKEQVREAVRRWRDDGQP